MNRYIDDRRPIAVDLFSGVGGMSLGFEQAGFEIAACIELDPVHCASHEFNFPHCATICSDVMTLDSQYVIDRLNGRKPDVVFGGAPCQGFSLIGKRALDDPRNSLVLRFVELVAELDAKYFVFENVKGLTLGEHKKFLQEIIQAFDGAGYDVVEEYKVLNALYYGVPQSRERLFLFGCKKGLKLPCYPKPTHDPDGVKKQRTPTVGEALYDLPNIEKLDVLFKQDWHDKVRFKKKSDYADLMGEIEDTDHYGYSRKYDSKVLTSSLRTRHTPVSIERFTKTPRGKTEKISRFLKLDPHGYCNTLRAGTASDRGAHTSPRPINPYHPRCITNREAMRLHSYPDWFRVHTTKWHGFRQIGNSVPPLLARAVASEIMKAMNIIPSKPPFKIDLGDPSLLKLSMSEAAKKYHVSQNVIPQRVRKKVVNG